MNDIETIKGMYLQYWKYMIEKDEAGLRKLMSEDYYLMHMTGTRQSADEFISGLMGGTFNYYSADHDDIQVITDGDTAYSVLVRVCRAHGLTVVNSGSKLTPYISGVGDLYEAEYGPTSGWGYKVNGSAPSVGAGSYTLSDGDTLEWLYVPDVSLLGD